MANKPAAYALLGVFIALVVLGVALKVTIEHLLVALYVMICVYGESRTLHECLLSDYFIYFSSLP